MTTVKPQKFITNLLCLFLCTFDGHFNIKNCNIIQLIIWDATPISNCQPIRLLNPYCWYKFTYWMTNIADPDQLASPEANWSGSTLFAKGRARVKVFDYFNLIGYVFRFSVKSSLHEENTSRGRSRQHFGRRGGLFKSHDHSFSEVRVAPGEQNIIS